MFGGETNVSVGQFNQSSIEILFAVCHGRISVALSRSKPSVVCSESGFLPKNCAQSSKITTTSSMNLCRRTQIHEDQSK